MKHRTLLIVAWITVCAGGVHAQRTDPTITRAEVLGRLAAGEPPSYVAHLVKVRGTNFSVTASFLEMVRRAGGAGILLDRLSTSRCRAAQARRPCRRSRGCR